MSLVLWLLVVPLALEYFLLHVHDFAHPLALPPRALLDAFAVAAFVPLVL
jgi:hypothetical protein